MLQIAKIVKSNGTDGGLLISFLNLSPEELNLKEPIFIYFDELSVPFFIQDIQIKSTVKAIIHLNDVVNLTDAEELVGKSIYIDCEWEDETEEDFTGWTLYDKGSFVGTITGMEYFPSNPCLCIENILIPINEDFILSLNAEKRTLDLDLPNGLFD